MIGILYKIERQKLKQTNRGDNYTINKMIIPTSECDIPVHQKSICSNKILVDIEKGKYHKNDNVYFNIAIKLHRRYTYNFTYHAILETAAKNFLDNLFDYRYGDIIKSSNSLSFLKESNLLFYQETALQLQSSIDFIYYKKELNIQLFEHMSSYFSLLSENLQLVFGYTLSMYFYHRDSNLTPLTQLLNYAENKNIKSHLVIQDLILFYHFAQESKIELTADLKKEAKHLFCYAYLNDLQQDYTKLNTVIDLINSQSMPLNPLLKEEIYASIGFFYTLMKDYHTAFEYFQKCYSIVLIKYLPCVYVVSKHVQPSLWRLKKYIKSLCYYENNSMIALFNLIINLNETTSKKNKNIIIQLISTEFLPMTLYHYHSPYYSFIKEFFYLLLIELTQTKNHD